METDNDQNGRKNEPFNDAMEYMQNIEGYPPQNDVNFNKLPKGIRYIGYFFIGFIGIAVLMVLIGNFLF